MKASSVMRFAAASLAVGGVAVLAIANAPRPAASQTTFVENGRAGFVLTNIAFALSTSAEDTGACPNGWTTGVREQYAAMPGGAQREGESDQDYTNRVNRESQALSTAPNGQNLCAHPEAGAPNSGWRTVDVANIPAYGLDLDALHSPRNAPAGACQHADFRGFHGERGIDNQFFRVVGCSRSYQPGGQSWDNTPEMLTGSWGVLITLDGVDDVRNDDDVVVGFYGNADPIQLSPNREAVPSATYAMTQDPRFRSSTHGRIRDGVLTTDPVDVRFYKVTAAMYTERPLRRAVLQATLSNDGVMEGILAGYAPVEAIYDHQYAYRNGTTRDGQPSPERLRLGSSNGNAGVNNHTCNGAYFALYANADGDYDPATRRCTSISTQYRIRAIPAFVVDTSTSSANSDLDAAGRSSY